MNLYATIDTFHKKTLVLVSYSALFLHESKKTTYKEDKILTVKNSKSLKKETQITLH